MVKVKRLKEFENQFKEIIKCDDQRKDIRLSKLMTEMEREFGIPILKNEEWEKNNKSVVALYRKISMSRSL